MSLLLGSGRASSLNSARSGTESSRRCMAHRGRFQRGLVGYSTRWYNRVFRSVFHHRWLRRLSQQIPRRGTLSQSCSDLCPKWRFCKKHGSIYMTIPFFNRRYRSFDHYLHHHYYANFFHIQSYRENFLPTAVRSFLLRSYLSSMFSECGDF